MSATRTSRDATVVAVMPAPTARRGLRSVRNLIYISRLYESGRSLVTGSWPENLMARHSPVTTDAHP
jgi:hypothetical protein